jgi:hypothetical protein
MTATTSPAKKSPVRRRLLTALGAIAVLLAVEPGKELRWIGRIGFGGETIKPQFDAMNRALAARAAG